MEASNSISIYTTLLACLCYSYFISSKIPKGLFRLISLLPVFYYLSTTFLPAAITAVAAVLFLTSLANFVISTPPKNKPINWSYTTIEFVVLLTLSITSYEKRSEFHPTFLHVIYCISALLAVDCVGISASLLLRATVGMEVQPPSNHPYLAASLQDFWGRRWDLTVTNLLRRTIYFPARSASAVVVGQRWAPLTAVMATFTVSGLVHEVFFYKLTKAGPSWEMTSFFVLHGFCVAVEVAVKKAIKGRWSFPRWVSTPLTVGFVMLTAYCLFFPPLLNNGLDVIVLEEFRASVEFARNELLVNLGVEV